MAGPAPVRSSPAFLIALWFVLLVLGTASVWAMIHLGNSALALTAISCLGLPWLVITGILVRRWWPESRLGHVLPHRIHGQPAEGPVRHGELVVILAIVALLVVVAVLFARAH